METEFTELSGGFPTTGLERERPRLLVISGLEALVFLSTGYVAIGSILNSPFSQRFYSHIISLLERYTPFLSNFMPLDLVLALLVLIIGFLVFIRLILGGVSRNYYKIYRIAFFLYLLDVYSFSRVNWLRVIPLYDVRFSFLKFKPVYLADLTFLRGVILISGVVFMNNVSSFREEINDYYRRGFNSRALERAFFRKVAYSLTGLVLSILVTLGVFLVSYIQIPEMFSSLSVGVRISLFSALSIILMAFSAFIYLSSRGLKES